MHNDVIVVYQNSCSIHYVHSYNTNLSLCCKVHTHIKCLLDNQSIYHANVKGSHALWVPMNDLRKRAAVCTSWIGLKRYFNDLLHVTSEIT